MADRKEGENKAPEYDMFISDEVFPDATKLFAAGPTSLATIKDDCLVVLDTNVLLIPFTARPESLDQIETTLRTLVAARRLYIPGQVAREFVKNRAAKLSEIFQQLNRKIGSTQLQREHHPLLNSLDSYQKVLTLENELESKYKEYKKALLKVRDQVQNWIWNDPVSVMYSSLFTDQVVVDPSYDKKQVAIGLEKRHLHKLPPGYKDGAKDDSGIGDYLIWLTILEIGKTHQKNLLFVTGDEKGDWWHKGDKQPLYPRFELVDEYRRVSDQKVFHMIHFSTLLALYGASKSVVEEIRQKESVSNEPSPEYYSRLLEFRASIRDKLRTLARLLGDDVSERRPTRHYIDFLAKQGIEIDMSWRLVEEILMICDVAAHTKSVAADDMSLIANAVPAIMLQLDRQIVRHLNAGSPDFATK